MSERPSPASSLDPVTALTVLTLGALEISGQLSDASNLTLYCTAQLDGVSAACVYKPVRGERPLWDFPDGTLAGREVAAYLVSAASGWDLVPPTVLRDGPLGPGMCQLWIESGPIDSLLRIMPTGPVPESWHAVVNGIDGAGMPVTVLHSDAEPLRRMAVLDAVINNADRKGGHLLLDAGGAVYGVDHGVSFHVEDKLRTLLWGWAGNPLTEEARSVLTRLLSELDGELGEQLHEHLTRREVGAVGRRINRLLRSGRHPRPGQDWPSVPWPPF